MYPAKKLSALLNALEIHGLVAEYHGDMDVDITSLSHDSRKVEKGALFACKGIRFRYDFLNGASQLGAAAYFSETRYEECPLPCIIVTNIRHAMVIIAREFYGNPQDKLKIVGITGTKGKTTTAFFIKNIFRDFAGCEQAYLTSIEMFTGKRESETGMTTPEPFDLYRYFYNAVNNGIKHLVMEVSSQAYNVDRVYGLTFDVGIFLNIGIDHISPSEHKDFNEYFSCKLRLMDNCRHAVINANMDNWEEVYQRAKSSAVTESITVYANDEKGNVRISDITPQPNGSFSFNVSQNGIEKEFKLKIPGRFNVENAAAAICACRRLGISDSFIASGLKNTTVEGRMQVIQKGSLTAIVDYAHNFLSMSKLLESVVADFPNRPITMIFGCSGGKAYMRRKDIGTLAGQYAYRVFLTRSDPNFEDVNSICEEIASFIKPFGDKYEIIIDREKAIHKAVTTARENEIIMVTGKGDEAFDGICGVDVPRKCDAQMVSEALELI
ncbi:MAG: UDP-N-acetylmuramyl-tripeptide synthetase [Clostridiales bacterium]|nr:UDP-N-acetylmuramyl-tripeptide synthetase [Clostridiales bacterium]